MYVCVVFMCVCMLGRYETLKLLEMPDVFQTDEEMGRCTIQVYPFHMLFKSL